MLLIQRKHYRVTTILLSSISLEILIRGLILRLGWFLLFRFSRDYISDCVFVPLTTSLLSTPRLAAFKVAPLHLRASAPSKCHAIILRRWISSSHAFVIPRLSSPWNAQRHKARAGHFGKQSETVAISHTPMSQSVKYLVEIRLAITGIPWHIGKMSCQMSLFYFLARRWYARSFYCRSEVDEEIIRPQRETAEISLGAFAHWHASARFPLFHDDVRRSAPRDMNISFAARTREISASIAYMAFAIFFFRRRRMLLPPGNYC